MKKTFLALTVVASFLSCGKSLNDIPKSVQTGLLAWYPFSDDDKDMSGNKRNPLIDQGTLITEKNITCLRLEGNDIFQTSLKGVSGNGSRTLSLWVKTLFGNSPDEYVGTGTPQTNGYGDSFMFLVSNNIQGQASVAKDISNSMWYYPLNNLNSWHHYAMVYDNKAGTTSGSIKVYQDGVLLTNSLFDCCNPDLPINTTLSNFQSQYFGNGAVLLDDIRFYNRPLSQQDLKDVIKTRY